MNKPLFFTSLSLLYLSGILMTMNACKSKTEEAPAGSAKTQSTLLKDPLKGKPFSNGTINDFVLAEKDNQVVLLAVNNTTGMVYAIDLEDHDASKASVNAVTNPVSNFGAQLALSMGVSANQLSILNMETNPISKSVYLLVQNLSNNTNSVVKVSNGGNTMSVVDFSNVSYTALAFSSIGEKVNDIAWGDNTMYLSYSHPSTLVGKIASASAPFAHNGSMSSRSTTVFKSNWGSSYFTDAPLESMCYAEIGGVKRLMGVTVCAPGFSFKTSDIQGSGLLQIKEYFNLNTGSANKVYPVVQNGKTYLIEHHFDGRITRVGEKYLDESRAQFNANAKYILASGGSSVAAGLNDEDVKIIANPGTYIISAKHTDTQLLAFNANGSLSLIAF